LQPDRARREVRADIGLTAGAGAPAFLEGMPASATQVLIVGAGPTGLALALWLARAGIKVRIIDREPQPSRTSRAIAVQARTLELYGQLGIADAAVARGLPLNALNLWVGGEKAAQVLFGDIGSGKSPYPFVLMLAQDEHERLLVAELERTGVTVERGTALTGFELHGNAVRARLTTLEGRTAECEAAYLAGCDGASSSVRRGLGFGFPGGTYARLFYVADLLAEGPGADGELHIALDDAGVLAAFPLRGSGHVRLIGTVRAEGARAEAGAEPAPAAGRPMSWNDVDKSVLAHLGVRVRDVKWFSTYHVHHRVVERFGAEPVFLLGDAAHIHSPVGGQGMNTGIGDAFNLGWKLADVLNGRAMPSLLETYDAERRAFAERLVETTDRIFTLATRDGLLARWLRTRAMPGVLARVFGTDRGRALLFATVSQTRIRYRKSPISEGHAKLVHAGDRLPYFAQSGDGADDNYAPLRSRWWQLHVYGDPKPGFGAVRAVCDERGVEVVQRPWRAAAGEAGLMPGALYLVRPDGHLGYVDADARPNPLEEYLDRRLEGAEELRLKGARS
jgi:2-polyprenyl-6-methoxyphenol hydroxylase-like FAD-dependent oxidoreductase